MQLGSPFDALHAAIAAACATDLPAIKFWRRDWTAYNKLSKEDKAKLRPSEGPGEWVDRRPLADEVEVIMFAQTWGSTALGYGGMGGASMTPAYTVIVMHRHVACVYFGSGGRLAYSVPLARGDSAEFRDRMKGHNMPDRREAKELGWDVELDR